MSMRPFILAAALAALPLTAAADPVDTFRQFCLANAPDTGAIKQSVQRAGFRVMELGPNMFMASRGDEAVQVNVATRHSFECAVTTSSEGNPAATGARFFNALGLSPDRNTAAGRIGNNSYTFKYDPEGGEAFVMYIR